LVGFLEGNSCLPEVERPCIYTKQFKSGGRTKALLRYPENNNNTALLACLVRMKGVSLLQYSRVARASTCRIATSCPPADLGVCCGKANLLLVHVISSRGTVKGVFFYFVHRLYFNKHLKFTTFRKLDLLPSPGKKTFRCEASSTRWPNS
jgi:hypothetical protein